MRKPSKKPKHQYRHTSLLAISMVPGVSAMIECVTFSRIHQSENLTLALPFLGKHKKHGMEAESKYITKLDLCI